MDKNDYHDSIMSIETDYRKKLHNTRLRYAEDNAKYKVGDFVQNKNGIIKIETISYRVGDHGEVIVVYRGHKYRKRDGIINLTKKVGVATISEPVKLV